MAGRSSSTNAEGPNSRQRLELTARICEAVHHAHRARHYSPRSQTGKILSTTGQPKILDFGVGRATDSDAHLIHQTDFGQLVGTLAYMIPNKCWPIRWISTPNRCLRVRCDARRAAGRARTLSHQSKIARGHPNYSGRRRAPLSSITAAIQATSRPLRPRRSKTRRGATRQLRNWPQIFAVIFRTSRSPLGRRRPHISYGSSRGG